MAKLIEITEEKSGSTVHPTPIAKLLGTHKIIQVLDASGGAKSEIIMENRQTEPLHKILTENVAAVLALQNAPAAADKVSIPLTLIKIEGDVAGHETIGIRNFSLKNIQEVQADPLDATNSIVTVEERRSSVLVHYFVDETVAAILALANA